MIDELYARGEYVSLLVVALLLWAAVAPTARLLDLRPRAVGDLFWNGGIAFVVGGRLAYLVLESPRTLLDPLVLIRVQSGIEPLAGVAAVALVAAWHARRRGELWPWFTVAAVGLAVATIGYDVACVTRDACYGAAAPPPLGFRMSGLSETRLATPIIEAAVLLALLAGLLATTRLPFRRHAALMLVGALALVRAALTPASALGSDALGFETAVLVICGVAALAGGLVLAVVDGRSTSSAEPEGGRLA